MFRRRQREGKREDSGSSGSGTDEVGIGDVEGADRAGSGGEPGQPEQPEPPMRRQGGPWDLPDLPDDGVNRVDLGGLLVPVAEGIEVRVDVDQSTGAVVSATLATPISAMQVLAFAAPRTAGIWAEVREEIQGSIVAGGGSAQLVEGPYGTELQGRVPTDAPGQLAAARFVGVDGPRWFLRGLIQGQEAEAPGSDSGLLAAFGAIGVVRGEEAMAVRDPLPLRLPKEALEAAAAATDAAPADEDTPDLSLPERGPEITETR